jgi:hypothetical protein
MLVICSQIFSSVNDNVLQYRAFGVVARLLLNQSIPILQRNYACYPKDGANLTAMDLAVSNTLLCETDRVCVTRYTRAITYQGDVTPGPVSLLHPIPCQKV